MPLHNMAAPRPFLLSATIFHINYSETFPVFFDTCEGVQPHVPLQQRRILRN